MATIGTRGKDNTLTMGDHHLSLKESSSHEVGKEQKQLSYFFSKATKDVGRRYLFLENSAT
jgi:hypothetical protein